MRAVHGLPLALVALLLAGACAYDGATGYAPTDYPADYDSGMGSGLVSQPGDRFGGQDVASVAVFEAPLAPYGEWVNSRFGRAFRPDVDEQWRPYVNGQWGEDRLWISNDPWGWATDHYGRWGFDEQIGWVWVPGTDWAPSWVAFRDDPAQNVSGWAPIPPNVTYSLNFGFGSGFGYDNFNNWYAPSWVWVPRGYVYRPGFGGRVLPWRFGANYWGGSRWQFRPGWGGDPHVGGAPGFRRPGSSWQARPPLGGQYDGRPPLGGQYDGRPPRGGQYQGRPPLGGQYEGVPPQDGQFRGRPRRPDDRAGAPRGEAVQGGGRGESFANQPRRDRPVGSGYQGSQAQPNDPPTTATPRSPNPAPSRPMPSQQFERASPAPEFTPNGQLRDSPPPQ